MQARSHQSRNLPQESEVVSTEYIIGRKINESKIKRSSRIEMHGQPDGWPEALREKSYPMRSVYETRLIKEVQSDTKI